MSFNKARKGVNFNIKNIWIIFHQAHFQTFYKASCFHNFIIINIQKSPDFDETMLIQIIVHPDAIYKDTGIVVEIKTTESKVILK